MKQTPLLLALAACVPDDWNGSTPVADTGPAEDTGPVDGGDGDDAPLVGAWRSEGADLSPLFASPPFSYTRVDATFTSDGAYTVATTDGGGVTTELTGTFAVVGAPPADPAEPQSVALTQTAPYAAEVEGIFAVPAPDTLVWEVVQIVPDYGFTPPTPTTGFGGTAGPGLTGGENVQHYVRVSR